MIHRKTIQRGLKGTGIQPRTGAKMPAAISPLSARKPKRPGTHCQEELLEPFWLQRKMQCKPQGDRYRAQPKITVCGSQHRSKPCHLEGGNIDHRSHVWQYSGRVCSKSTGHPSTPPINKNRHIGDHRAEHPAPGNVHQGHAQRPVFQQRVVGEIIHRIERGSIQEAP